MQLLAYIQNDGAEYWHSGSNCYLTVQVNGHAEHMPLPSYAAKQYSKALFYNTSKKIISDQNIKETLGLLEALAKENKRQYEVAIRSCHMGEASYIDLGHPDWSVVRVTADAWNLISSQECPVRFLRPGGMLPLPTPVHGGHLRDLKRLLNVDERGLVLTTAWLLSALAGLPPFPLLALAGEQGTCKSTAGSVLRRLVDPHQADRRRAPQSERDLFVAAQNTYILSFENLSSIPDWMSDALCAFSTGGTFTARRLYSDNEEVFLNAVRPVIVNGIPDLVSRPDLADRALVVQLEHLDQKNRLTERAFWAQFDALQPQLLGVLCDALVMGLAHMDSVTLDVQPRMLDFAKLVIAAEPTLPWPPGTFLREFIRMRSEAVSSILDGNAVAAALLRWADDHIDWTGTVGELLSGLTATTYQDRRPPTTWPTSARQLGGELRRLAPALREQGYEITPLGRGAGGAYQYNFRRTFTTSTADTSSEVKSVEINASRLDSVAAMDSEGHER